MTFKRQCVCNTVWGWDFGVRDVFADPQICWKFVSSRPTILGVEEKSHFCQLNLWSAIKLGLHLWRQHSHMQSPVEGCDSQAPALTGWLAFGKGPEIVRHSCISKVKIWGRLEVWLDQMHMGHLAAVLGQGSYFNLWQMSQGCYHLCLSDKLPTVWPSWSRQGMFPNGCSTEVVGNAKYTYQAGFLSEFGYHFRAAWVCMYLSTWCSGNPIVFIGTHSHPRNFCMVQCLPDCDSRVCLCEVTKCFPAIC